MSQIFKTPKGTELPILDMRGKPYLQVAHRLVWFREEHADWRIETQFIQLGDKHALAKAEIRDAQGNVMATAHKFENQAGFPDFLEKAETGSIGRALALVGFGTQFCSDELEEGQRLADAPINRGIKPARPGPEDGTTTPRPGMLFYSSMAGRHVTEIERQKGRGWMEEERDRIANLPSETAQRDYHTLDEYLKLSEGMTPEPFTPNDQPDEALGVAPGEYEIPFGKKYKGRKVKDIAETEIRGYLEWLETDSAKKKQPVGFEVKLLKKAIEMHYKSPVAGMRASRGNI